MMAYEYQTDDLSGLIIIINSFWLYKRLAFPGRGVTGNTERYGDKIVPANQGTLIQGKQRRVWVGVTITMIMLKVAPQWLDLASGRTIA